MGLVERLAEIAKTDATEAKTARGLAEVFTGEAEITRRLPEGFQKLADLGVQYEIYSKLYLGTAAIPNSMQFNIHHPQARFRQVCRCDRENGIRCRI
jgi:hypothetical protein